MHWLLQLVIIVLLAGGVTPARAVNGQSPALCGPDDAPETGIQGDVPLADQQSGRADAGYNCGLKVVAHNDLGGQGGGDLAWSRECAYVEGGGGIMVLNLSDPTNPVVTAVAPTAGSTAENLHAVTTGERAVLAAGSNLYDVHDCLHPELLGVLPWQDTLGAHNATVGPDATKVYASFGVQQVDITDLHNPNAWTAKNFACDVLAQFHPLWSYWDSNDLCKSIPGVQSMSHEVELNKSGTRMYIAGQQEYQGDEYLLILDMTTDPPHLISNTVGRPGHGMRRATIGGKPFLLHSDETAPGIPQNAERRANGCLAEEATPFAGAAFPYLTDISTETAPETKGRLQLAINKQEPEFCAAALESSVNSTSHYHEVDDPDNTTFAMVSMKNAGLRIFDVRNPADPIEVAYFNPGQSRASDGTTALDRARLHTHYHASTGQIWLTTESHGFYVLELEPQVREALGLPEPSAPLAIALGAALIVFLRRRGARDSLSA
jgi:hypothetical protein